MPIAESNQFTFGPAISQAESGFAHNGIYRGKNLGTITSANIDEFCTVHEIAEGKFTDLYLGDYFMIQDGSFNIEWMVAGFNYAYNYKKTADAWANYYNAAILPRGAGVEKRRFESTDSTANGIYRSELGQYLTNTETPGNFFSIFKAVLGDHMVWSRVYASHACDSDGTASQVTSGTASVVIPAEIEFFGSSAGGKNPNLDCNGKHLLPVFNYISPNQFSNEEYWIGGIANGTQYQATRHGGYGVFRGNASSTNYYIRPLMFIGDMNVPING